MKALPKRSAMETGQSHFSSPKACTLQHCLFPQRGYMAPNCVLMENVFASIDGCLQTSCSFLFSALFLKESRTSPSYPPARLLQAQKDASTRQGSDLFSTSRQEGAGCHRSWCFPLLYTTDNTATSLF